ANDLGFLAGEGVHGAQTDEARGALDLGHDVVAGVDAAGAADAFHLEAVADVDAGGADLDAHGAVHAVLEFADLAGAVLAAGLAALDVVSDDQGVGVDHDALEAAVGAGDLADFLAS